MLRPGQRRASAPKVRSGCLTCKTRRVKCDETKPRCNQCIKSARDCQWKRPAPNTTARPLVPIISAKQADAVELVKTPTQALPFENNRESQYFRTYKDEVARELAAAIRASPWVESVLRACHTEPSILRAVIAIGALNKSWKLAHFADHGPVSMKAMTLRAASSHREYALASYSKALAGLKIVSQTAVSSPTSLRHILIGCLLVHCMEVFLQSTESAFQHSTVGYNLLVDYVASDPSLKHSYKWISSPNTAIVEDSIFHEYTRLQNDRSLSPYSPSLSHHQKARRVGETTIANLPARFSSLEEAQDFQELIEQRTTHLIAEVRATIKQSYELLGQPVASSLPGHVVEPYVLPHITHLYAIRDEYLASLRVWEDAFAPLLSRLHMSPDTRLCVGSAVQQTRSLNSIIALITIFATSETVYDQFYAFYAETLALITRSIKVTPHVCNDLRPVFQISSTFHHPIGNLVVNCRDKAVREQALAIMVRLSPRDGDLERSRRVFSHKFLVALEESNRAEDGSLPAHLRYRIVSNHTHGPDLSYTVVATRRVHDGPDSTLYPTSRLFRWKTWTAAEAADFAVGDLVSDLAGEEAVDKERVAEIAKWPAGLEKPPWIQWWLVLRQLKAKARRRATILRLDLRLDEDDVSHEEETAVSATAMDDDQASWEDIPEDQLANDRHDIDDNIYDDYDSEGVPTQQQRRRRRVVIEQIGGFGAFVPSLDIHGSQDLAAIQRAIY